MGKYGGKPSRLSSIIDEKTPVKVKPVSSGRITPTMGAGWDFITYLFDSLLGNFRRHRIIIAGIGAGME